MRQELTVRQQTALNAKLDRLGRAAHLAHERAKVCAAKLVENAARAGQALCKARDLCDTDDWDDFLVNKFKGSERTAQRYMYIARHWTLLKAVAPPEALTSVRKATQLLNTLLVGEHLPDGAATRRRKKRASGRLQLPAPPAVPDSAASAAAPAPDQALTVAAEDDEQRTGLRRMYREMQRTLDELSHELTELTPRHYHVTHAIEAIRRARFHFFQAGHTLFSISASAAGSEENSQMHGQQ